MPVTRLADRRERRPVTAGVAPADLPFYAALALMPVDGTVFGMQMPYWSPISPLLLALYVAVHARCLPRVIRMVPALMPVTLGALAISSFGWLTVGVNGTYLLRTVVALVCAAATLAAFAIAWTIRRLPMRHAVSVIVAAYGMAFAFGVFTWLIQPDHLDIAVLRAPLHNLYLRQYFVVRPQFLFAEPSYIGMHLFGVLLPLFWITRDRRLPALIVVFAAGALVMGSGLRIVLDSAAAIILCLVAACPWRSVWRRPRTRAALVVGLLAVPCAGVIAFATQPRLQALATHGLLAGDASMSARIFRSASPLIAGMHDLPHLLFGYGAGNLGEAMRRGYEDTMSWYQSLGGVMTAEIAELRDPLAATANRAGNAFTMDAYASFIVEFGVIAFLVALGLIIRHLNRHHAWTKRTICWLVLLAYLYSQFEAYAFAALPLLLWATADGRAGSPTGSDARPSSATSSVAPSAVTTTDAAANATSRNAA